VLQKKKTDHIFQMKRRICLVSYALRMVPSSRYKCFRFAQRIMDLAHAVICLAQKMRTFLSIYLVIVKIKKKKTA